MMRKAALLAALLLSMVAPPFAAGGPLKTSVSVDASAPAIIYDRMLFGGFLEHFHRQIYGGIFEPGSPLADPDGYRRDVLEAVRELGTPVVRWPGGCFVSAYHWKDGVGRDRVPVFDKAWGVEDPNTFGTDEFIEWCRRAGVEPYICGNAGTGTPEEMSDWVEFCNQRMGRWARIRAENGHPEPYGVRYWSIGNENYGSWEIGAKTAQEWGLFVRETAKMMRRTDGSIVLLAAALADEAWTSNLLREAGAALNMVSIHGYYDPLWQTDAPSGYLECVLRSGEPERSVAATERIIAGAGLAQRVAIAFDEWNLRGWHHPGHEEGSTPEQIKARDRNDINATYTMADAVFSASFLNTCLRHAGTVKMANIAPLVNARGPIYVHPGGVVKRTTYHVLSMYSRLLKERVVRTETSCGALTDGKTSVPVLDAVATCDAARRTWRIVLVNRHPSESLLCAVILDGRPLAGRHAATALSGDSTDAYNDLDKPDRVLPRSMTLTFGADGASVPPHSVVVLDAVS